jgi:CRP-like cAMP-binding protein
MTLRQRQALQPGERMKRAGEEIRNKLLLEIPEEEFLPLQSRLQFVKLSQHLNLHQSHQIVKFAYFPNDGLISLVVEMKNGKGVEAGIIGNDGASGVPAIFGLSRSPLRHVVQIAGTGFRVKVSEMRETLQSVPHFQAILSRYAAGLAMQVAQTAACNRLHKIEKRLARWLLIANDRVASAILPITHDFLAIMLGTDRPTVTLAAGILQRKKIIEYRRGSVKIINRKGLEQFACECYAVVRQYQ